MIEMLQQPKMPAAKAASNPSKIDPAGHESGAASPSEASFDQQLDQQIRQGSNSRQQAVPGEKSNVNQGAKEPEAVEVSDQESVDQPSVEMTGALSSEMESEQLMLEMAIDGEAVTDSELFAHMTGTDRGMEQNLPLDGKDLPPELVALITPQTEVAETLVQQTLPHKAGASD
ncbi:MAG: hypothetical protein EP315_01655, partial [Gammaproteobacteria bacterium]